MQRSSDLMSTMVKIQRKESSEICANKQNEIEDAEDDACTQERKREIEGERERDAFPITEPSAHSWRPANTTDSWRHMERTRRKK